MLEIIPLLEKACGQVCKAQGRLKDAPDTWVTKQVSQAATLQ
jgi:hypothetical protein